jgi:hypothetical protein
MPSWQVAIAAVILASRSTASVAMWSRRAASRARTASRSGHGSHPQRPRPADGRRPRPAPWHRAPQTAWPPCRAAGHFPGRRNRGGGTDQPEQTPQPLETLAGVVDGLMGAVRLAAQNGWRLILDSAMRTTSAVSGLPGLIGSSSGNHLPAMPFIASMALDQAGSPVTSRPSQEGRAGCRFGAHLDLGDHEARQRTFIGIDLPDETVDGQDDGVSSRSGARGWPRSWRGHPQRAWIFELVRGSCPRRRP